MVSPGHFWVGCCCCYCCVRHSLCLYSLGYPRTHYVDQTYHRETYVPASPSACIKGMHHHNPAQACGSFLNLLSRVCSGASTVPIERHHRLAHLMKFMAFGFLSTPFWKLHVVATHLPSSKLVSGLRDEAPEPKTTWGGEIVFYLAACSTS